METEIKKLNLVRLGITVGLVLLTALVVGGTTWYVMDTNAKTEKEANDKAIAALQAQVDELQAKGKTTKDTDWKNYVNTDYNFELAFNDKWKNYTVLKKGPGTWGAKYLNSYEFKLPTNDSNWSTYNPVTVFDIKIYAKNEWNKISASGGSYDGPIPTFINSKNDKVFTYSIATQWPTDWNLQGGNNGDVKTVISSFKFN